ncbi:MAG: cobyrinate a,c-diamide synthase [Thermocladium sp.]
MPSVVMHLPRLVIGGISSGVGKTMVSTGIMAALSKKLRVQPFKIGPDFIDTSFHALATGNSSINLDTWLMGDEGVLSSFARHAVNADVSIIEGVMGIFDGESRGASTISIAKLLSAPIVLVIDCHAMGETGGMLVKGFSDVISAVIFNRAAGSHCDLCKWGASRIGAKVLGCIPYDSSVHVPERHLGLRMAHEVDSGFINSITRLIEDNIDLDELLRIANEAPDIDVDKYLIEEHSFSNSGVAYVAFDSAFNFYYRDNIDALSRSFSVKFFSPVAGDTYGDDANLVILGGGYPELFLNELASNQELISKLRRDSMNGLPIYAECGGLMYLSRYIRRNEREFPMVNLFDVGIEMTNRLTLSYSLLESLRDSPISMRGDSLRGHEFHYSSAEVLGEVEFAHRVLKGRGINGFDGLITHNSLAQYTHINFVRGNAIERLVNISNSYSRR